MKKFLGKMFAGLFKSIFTLIISIGAVMYVSTVKPSKKGLRNAVIVTVLTVFVKDMIPFIDELVCIFLLFKKYNEYRGLQEVVQEGVKEQVAQATKQQPTKPASGGGGSRSGEQLTWTDGKGEM